ncbi:hydroxyacylglutathione hydrolase [Beijerinckia indica subsp. indica ATCC 9039]|uniref:Hydroxyacylglutathione hydrolase n=2 Tax=Beijerinckia TaxID=532 RepID=B2ID72_BEII9|nr:hydroxyacylglutathione hydrolase [Beijerinckia indica subsp. indica ATCC 9039]
MSHEKRIAIVGGGASGALLAYQLTQKAIGARVIVIDPSPTPALGLAYSTPSSRHLLNVTAGGMSALPDQPEHFLNWLCANHNPQATAMTFAPRIVFGHYLQSLYALSSAEHLRAQVHHYKPAPVGGSLVLGNGQVLAADLVILATGNFDPAPLPAMDEIAKNSGFYHHNAWDRATFEGLDPDEPIALIGTGLTAVDVVLRLRELGHRAVITTISRHGLFPNRHETYEKLDHCALPDEVPASALAYFRAFRRALRSGLPWRSVVDSLRARTNALWLALPLIEQKRFRRHLQRRWDIVRHRMAPSIADIIEAERADGTLLVCHGHVHGISLSNGRGEVVIKKGASTQNLPAARVINCTGSDLNYRRVASSLLNGLLEQGMIIAGPLGNGLKIDGSGAVYGREGRISDTLFTLGPARLGTLFESIAIPEIRQQAADLAAHLAERVR